jgi:hypothetical protein
MSSMRFHSGMKAFQTDIYPPQQHQQNQPPPEHGGDVWLSSQASAGIPTQPLNFADDIFDVPPRQDIWSASPVTPHAGGQQTQALCKPSQLGAHKNILNELNEVFVGKNGVAAKEEPQLLVHPNGLDTCPTGALSEERSVQYLTPQLTPIKTITQEKRNINRQRARERTKTKRAAATADPVNQMQFSPAIWQGISTALTPDAFAAFDVKPFTLNQTAAAATDGNEQSAQRVTSKQKRAIKNRAAALRARKNNKEILDPIRTFTTSAGISIEETMIMLNAIKPYIHRFGGAQKTAKVLGQILAALPNQDS